MPRVSDGFSVLAVRGAVSRQATGDEVIWFPVDDFKDVFESSLGEVALTKPPNEWLSEGFGRSGRHYRRTDEDGEEANSLAKTFWETEKMQPTEEAITFPGAAARRADACQANCPQTPQYHPVCGSDGVNYNNVAALNCARLCGKRKYTVKLGPHDDA